MSNLSGFITESEYRNLEGAAKTAFIMRNYIYIDYI